MVINIRQLFQIYQAGGPWELHAMEMLERFPLIEFRPFNRNGIGTMGWPTLKLNISGKGNVDYRACWQRVQSSTYPPTFEIGFSARPLFGKHAVGVFNFEEVEWDTSLLDAAPMAVLGIQSQCTCWGSSESREAAALILATLQPTMFEQTVGNLHVSGSWH